MGAAPSNMLLELKQMTKAFPGCLANDAVDLAIEKGQIHALLGENGAGKSTLVKMIYGVLAPDEGQMLWNGKPVQIDNPAAAREFGIAMVFQHFSLFDSLTVTENIALGLEGHDPAALASEIREVSTRYGLPLDPDRHVYTLSVGERQRIEIVRCLLQQPSLLIMDEPTSVLTPQEVSVLFETLRRLSAEGVSILYISHKLDEIRQLCHRATILRGGRKVAEADPARESAAGLAAMMIGSQLQTPAGSQREIGDEVLLSLNALDVPAPDAYTVSLQGISLVVHSGEILGMAGVAGNGQDELLMAISGERPVGQAAMVELAGQPIGSMTPALRRRLGICCVPEERLGHAAVPGISLADNAFLTAQHRQPLSIGGFIRRGPVRVFTNSIINHFQVQCRDHRSPANSLSGGNLQKFVVGREILQQPRVLVVSQPTWGVDAGAAAAIHEALVALAADGSAVLVISQDLDELMSVSDTIMAICAGKVSSIYRTRDLDVQQVGLLMGGEPQVAGVTPARNSGGQSAAPQPEVVTTASGGAAPGDIA